MAYTIPPRSGAPFNGKAGLPAVELWKQYFHIHVFTCFSHKRVIAAVVVTSQMNTTNLGMMAVDGSKPVVPYVPISVTCWMTKFYPAIEVLQSNNQVRNA